MVALTTIGLAIGGIAEIVPNLIQGAVAPKIEQVKPYTPLELHGRDIYIREGCVSCHTQMVRTLRADTVRYGEVAGMQVPAYTRPGEGIYDRPFLWGSKRTGPDLMREGIIRPDALWHYRHMYDPDGTTSPGSIMPAYPHLYTQKMDLSTLQNRINVLSAAPLYHPYEQEKINAIGIAHDQARSIAEDLWTTLNNAEVDDFGSASPTSLEELADQEIIALIAYLQRLGTDITK